MGLAKVSGRNYEAAASATREFAKRITPEWVQGLKASGAVTKRGLEQYLKQLGDAMRVFAEKGKDYSVQQARAETIIKILTKW